jgi:hypothetical protein
LQKMVSYVPVRRLRRHELRLLMVNTVYLV